MDENSMLLRPIDEREFPAYWDVIQAGFNSVRPVSEREIVRPTIEWERTLAVFDRTATPAPSTGGGPAAEAGPADGGTSSGGRSSGEQAPAAPGAIVGTCGAFSLTMTVPGGPRPVAGVTAVAVLPSHRRRGVFRAMMHRQLNDLHESGEPVAALWASESAIYGRYGYGCASQVVNMKIKRGEAAYLPDAPSDPALRVRLAAPADARPDLTALYAAQADRPGFIPRPDTWWDAVLHDPEYAREGYGPLHCVLVEDDTGPRGYALFSMRSGWEISHVPDGTLRILELFATDPAAHAAVWRHLLDRDLISTVLAPVRPVDDPVQYLVTDRRRLRPVVADGLWVRLVTLGRALTERAYAVPIDIVLGVDDRVCPWNTGNWRLSADATGATCERTTTPADVELPVSVLGSAYLGDARLAGPVRAGQITEVRRGAVNALSSALAWDPRPWCPMDF
jgi:predicted acetyltransferase